MLNTLVEYKAAKSWLTSLDQEIEERRAITRTKTAYRRKLRKEILDYEKKQTKV